MKIKLLILIGLISFLGSTSCKKPKIAKAVVSVVFKDKTPCEGAKVTLYSSPNGSYIDPTSLQTDSIQETNENGTVTFEVDRKCILSVKAEYDSSKTRTLKADGLLLFDLEETYAKTLILE